MADTLPVAADRITVVMYHYVRPHPDERNFRLDGLTPERFDAQLDYIRHHHSVVSLGDVVRAARGGPALPQRPCVLTFDDGLADHARHVLPRLLRRRWTGAFFACAAPLLEGRMLVVHRIHLLLAVSRADPQGLLRDVVTAIEDRRSEATPSIAALEERWLRPNRYDPAPVNFVKRTLQRGIPTDLADAITEDLFRTRVSADERDFAAYFYMDETTLRSLVDSGMEVGGHGVDHAWLDTLGPDEQERHVRGSRDLVARIHGGSLPDPWLFAYPYGAFDKTTVGLLERYGCGAAVTVRAGLAAARTPLLELPRLDTNDLPFDGDAAPCEWTRAVGVMETGTPPADP